MSEDKKTPTIEEWKRMMHGMLNGLKSIKRDRTNAEMDMLYAMAEVSAGYNPIKAIEKARKALDKFEAACKQEQQQNDLIRQYGREFYPSKVRLAAMDREEEKKS